MKVQKITTQPAFQPIELKITIEIEEEFNALLALSADGEYLTEELLSCDIKEQYVYFLVNMIRNIRASL